MTSLRQSTVKVPAAAVMAWQRAYARRLLITDFAVIAVSVYLSQFIRFSTTGQKLTVQANGDIAIELNYSLVSAVLVLAWFLSLAFFASRHRASLGSGATEYKRVADATIRVFAVLAVLAFLSHSEVARGYLFVAFPLGLGLLLLSRWLWRNWLARRRRMYGSYSYRAILMGERGKSMHVADQIMRDGGAGIVIVGAVTERGRTDRPLLTGVPVLGDYASLSRVLGEVQADTVVFTGADTIDPRGMRELGWQLAASSTNLIVAPALTDVAGPRIHARPVAGLPLIQVDYPEFEGARYTAKRAFDIVMSLIGLVILSPVFLITAMLVRLDTPGPAFFTQERVGVNGRRFHMVKFRSMTADAEAGLASLAGLSDGNGMLFKMKSDPRVTPIGAVLRRYSLDELPQLINVLRGHMSLVGPRPPLASEVERYDDWARRRLLVKPGITGLWQTRGRSSLSWDDSVRFDLYYVENWSLTGDIIILYRTINAVVQAKGAY
ncbi:sugar transferase [Rathayibacter soli]|uniref:sugar transferase n=1 Tax=Rathayibacter soli TaxID=3144168 RepID=UPI0027E588CB|nr:sugar transferase [Glaciibacter superstes]